VELDIDLEVFKLKYTLRSKLTLSYIFIVIIVVGMISLVANLGIQTKFQDYVIKKQEKQTKEIVDLITMRYEEDNGWNTGYLEVIGMNALQNGMIIEISDVNNKGIWSAYEHNNGLCQTMIKEISANMYSYSGRWKGEYQERTYTINSHEKTIGILTTGYVGPYYFDDEELLFIKALNSLFVIIGIGSLILAFAVGIVMSLRISNPLIKIANKAKLLSEGKYKERLENGSNTKEIGILIETINNLSDALENKENLRKQLTQDVAHELRTPLTSVQGTMEAMLDGIWPMNSDRLTSCYDEIIRIKRLIGSIEDLSGVENENVILNKEEFDISKLIHRLLHNYETDFATKNMKAIYHEENIFINGDEDKLSQVFHNLISNALKYSEEGSSCEINVTEKLKEIEISVKDTGIGISESDLPNIFERFYRADKSRNSETGGVGVGLTITKSIIEAHGGTITVQSQLGKGTEFLIVLPK
jgi:two-component system, OmpR family, sensor histidine kinase BaeS